MRQHFSRADLRVTITSATSPFLDGFSTASAAFLIELIEPLSALETALFTSLYLAGSFLGAAVMGSVADRYGRRPPYLCLMGLAAVFLTLAVFVPHVSVLLAMRLVTGFALGGDYPVAQAMVTERVGSSVRNSALSFLMLAWYFGALAGVFASIPSVKAGFSWSFIVGTQAVVAICAVLLRLSIQESPAWLATSHSRSCTRIPKSESLRKGIGEVFAAVSSHRREFFFCSGFWLCQSIPATILMLYSPTILADMTGSHNATVQMLLLYGFFLVGVLPSGAEFFASRPKAVLMATFVAMAVSLAGMMLCANQYVWLTNAAFVLFAISYGLQSPLDFVYPNALFSTEIRGTLVGTVTAVSRVGATGAAFLFPLLENAFDMTVLFSAGLAVLLLGFMIAWRFAPNDHPRD